MNNGEWELIERTTGGRRHNYGPKWSSVPAIAVSKHGITFNKPFVNLFLKDSELALVLSAKGARKIGLKLLPKGEFDEAAFNIRRQKSKHVVMSCKAIANHFSDCIGVAYRAHSSADGKVIEIELSAENKLR